jgi:hypothetical protein
VDGAVSHPVEHGRRVPAQRVGRGQVAQPPEDPQDLLAAAGREDTPVYEELQAHALADRVGRYAQVRRPHRQRHPQPVAPERGAELEDLVPRGRHPIVAEALVDRRDLGRGVDRERPLVSDVVVARVAGSDARPASLVEDVGGGELVERVECGACRGVPDEGVIDDQQVIRRRELDERVLAEARQRPRRPLDADARRDVRIDVVRGQQGIEAARMVPGHPTQRDGVAHRCRRPPQLRFGGRYEAGGRGSRSVRSRPPSAIHDGTSAATMAAPRSGPRPSTRGPRASG